MRNRKRLRRIIQAQETQRSVARAELAERRAKLRHASDAAEAKARALDEATGALTRRRAVGADALVTEAEAISVTRSHALLAKDVVEDWIRSCEEQSEVLRESAVRVRSFERADERLARREAERAARREQEELDDISAGRRRFRSRRSKTGSDK
ncbi:MAG: hypothetical protein AAGF12_32150 [Myxococcota bacterium]